MNLFSFIVAGASLLTAVSGAGTTTDKPGQCGAAGQTCPSGYTCVSILSTIAGLEKLSQCAPEPVCGGSRPGACPTFSAWPTKYRQLQPICAFVIINNCYNTTLGNVSANDGTVDCYKLNVPILNTTKTYDGIYKCVDSKKYVAENGAFNKTFTDAQVKSCAGNSTGAALCNGQGTCKAKSSLDLEYECLCNMGYSTTDNCFKSTSNACNNLGQCGELGECNTGSKTCTCQPGTSGNQCMSCTVGDAAACGGSKQGNCNTNGTCSCKPGYNGTFCDVEVDNASPMMGFSILALFLSIAFFGTIL